MRPATTRKVQVQQLHELLERVPRANIAFRHGDAIEAAPVAFRFQGGRYWIGMRATGPTRVAQGEPVKLLIDDGRWFFDLRGIWIGGRTAACDRSPDGASQELNWLELLPEKVVAWHYGTLREGTSDGA